MRRKLAELLSFVAVPILLGACDNILGHGCTLIGCFEGMVVATVRLQSEQLTVEAKADDDARTSVSVTCAGSQDDICPASFFDFTPHEATIRITGESDATSVTVRSIYEESGPNGAVCTPTCHIATVRVEFGAQGMSHLWAPPSMRMKLPGAVGAVDLRASWDPL